MLLDAYEVISILDAYFGRIHFGRFESDLDVLVPGTSSIAPRLVFAYLTIFSVNIS